MCKIKLLEIDRLEDGTQRFQSQLWVGSGSADFIMEPDGKMKALGYGEKGQDFYLYEGGYQIVHNKEDMAKQALGRDLTRTNRQAKGNYPPILISTVI